MLLGFAFAGVAALSFIFVVIPCINNLIILATAANYQSRHHGEALEILRMARIKDRDEEYQKSRTFGMLLKGIIFTVLFAAWSYASFKGHFLP